METKMSRIAQARKARGMSQSQLAEKIGTSQQQIARYESGTSDMKSSMLMKMSAALEVTISYLLGIDDGAPRGVKFVEVPLLGSIAAGRPLEMDEVDDYKPVPVDVHNRYPNAFLLTVRGESMNRIIPNGCYALVDPCDDVDHDGQPYAVCVDGEDATIKRVRKLNNGFELVPDSNDPTFRTKVFDYGIEGTETVSVIGRVVWYCLPFDWSFD